MKENEECEETTMRELIIGKNDADQRVDKFIMKTMKDMPKSLMYKYIRNKKIKVNRKRCEISQRLQEGDTMQCYIAEEFFEQQEDRSFLNVPSEVNVVYEDEHLVIVNKPVGLLAHSDTKEVQDNLADRLLHYLYKKKEYDPKQEQSFTPALCHRIDRNTQGIVICAKDAEALREMNEIIRNREIDKYYLCIVEGHMKKKEDHVVLYHKKLDGNKADVIPYEKEGYHQIQTGYRVLKEKDQYSLLEVQLHTGKSHQIRAVMAYLKHPLLGDIKYGAKKGEQRVQALCAYRIQFHLQKKDSVFRYLNHRSFVLEDVDLLKYF